jgi:histidinol dehydrogenase
MEKKKMKIITKKEIPESFYRYEEYEEIGVVKRILNDVKNNGDVAVLKYNKKFDSNSSTRFELTKEDIKRAYKKVDKDLIGAIKKAAENIRLFSKEQFKTYKEFKKSRKGVILGQKIVPLDKVGCYVPNGRYPLPSTALMCVIPAKIAGVKEIIVCSPNIVPATVAAADIAGADRIFSIGGVQAIGAMAYGTRRIPKVDKIVGPGNRYVTAAKKEVFGSTGIDMIAGPSEIMILSDETGNAKYIAADLLAQAEHDINARAYFITSSMQLAEEVKKEIQIQLDGLLTKDTATKSMDDGLIIVVKSIEEGIEIINKKAPEHLELQLKNEQSATKKLRNYGSLFIGKYSAEVFGDYCTGTNHTLPTNGAARYRGGLSVGDFIKVLTYQQLTKKAAKEMINVAMVLAETEGLDAHRKAAEMRRL